MYFATALQQTVKRCRLRWIRGRARYRQRSQHHLQLLMETYHLSRLLARDPLMCHYEVVAKDALPEVVSTYPSAFVCNTNDGDQPGEYWVAMYVDRSVTTSTVRTKAATRRVSNFMNERCSQWSPNDHILQSHISTVCGQYCVDFLMFRCRNISMHAFARLFTTDLIVNDCRVFDWLGALNTKMMKNICVC